MTPALRGQTPAVQLNDNIEFEWRQQTPWLVLSGEVDINSVEPISDAVLADYETAGTLCVDLRDVTFIDSLGIGLLLRLRHVSSAVQLVKPPRDVVRLLELCGVDPLFTIDRAAA